MFKIDIDLDLLEQYVSKAKVGDLKAKEKIIDLYMPFIIKTSSSFFINGMSKDDIKQEIITSLFVAINRYKGHNSFFWYAIKTMQNNLCSL
ncbi:MAG: helix-turn-helix domain-containing protein, partial [Sarcina sp.]